MSPHLCNIAHLVSDTINISTNILLSKNYHIQKYIHNSVIGLTLCIYDLSIIHVNHVTEIAVVLPRKLLPKNQTPLFIDSLLGNELCK